jgi:hypothetical protein
MNKWFKLYYKYHYQLFTSHININKEWLQKENKRSLKSKSSWSSQYSYSSFPAKHTTTKQQN